MWHSKYFFNEEKINLTKMHVDKHSTYTSKNSDKICSVFFLVQSTEQEQQNWWMYFWIWIIEWHLLSEIVVVNCNFVHVNIFYLKIYFPFGLRELPKWIWTYLFTSKWAKWKRIDQFKCDCMIWHCSFSMENKWWNCCQRIAKIHLNWFNWINWKWLRCDFLDEVCM